MSAARPEIGATARAAGEGGQVPIMIVGNKCDEENNREVKKELASKLVSEGMTNSGHMETSAKLNLNVQQAFQVSLVESPSTSEPATAASAADCAARVELVLARAAAGAAWRRRISRAKVAAPGGRSGWCWELVAGS